MALTSLDETDLLLPLFQDAMSGSGFSQFLERVRRRAEALAVQIIVRPVGTKLSSTMRYFSSGAAQWATNWQDFLPLGSQDLFRYDQLRPRRVYSTGEFIDFDPLLRAERIRNMAQFGVADERIVRLGRIDRMDAWIVLSCAKPCSATHSALLSALAPYVETALRCHLSLKSQQVASAMLAYGNARGSATSMILDADCRIVNIEPRISAWLSSNLNLTATAGARLELQPTAMRDLMGAVSDCLSCSAKDGVPLLISEFPRLEAVVMKVPDGPEDVVLAVCQIPHQRGPTTIERFAALHALPRREAELAILLNDGHSIASAAKVMGLSVETCRNYTKRIYAKLGVSGQAELVRLVCDSAAVLA